MIKRHHLFFVGLLLLPAVTLAATSPNYNISPEVTPQSSGQSGSANYGVDSVIGDPAVGESASDNYRVRHGTTYDDNAGNVTLDFRAVPEKRLPGHLDSRVIVEVRTPSNVSGPALYRGIVNTDVTGLYDGALALGIDAGIYDIYVKGFSHLKKMVHEYTLDAGANYIDFTATDSLLAGDVNVLNSADVFLEGDDMVNSIDLAILIEKLDQSGDIEKTDLNMDGMVNAIDLGVMIENIDKTGERP